jgi:hypothetical protein
MKKYEKNPRTLTAQQKKDLERDLRELGDLSGIVHEEQSDQIIGGNQRSDIFDVNSCEIEIHTTYDPPTKTGTVAIGFIHWNGERYPYRLVRWTEEQCDRANITANRAGGDWNWDKLVEGFGKDDLKNWGFEDKELGIFDNSFPKEGAEITDGWFLSIEFTDEQQCQEWYEKLSAENLKVKIVQ